MIHERILLVSVGWSCIGLFIVGIIFGIVMVKKKRRSGNWLLLWICELAVLIVVAFLSFTYPEFYKEKKKRMWTEVKKNGYIVTLNGQRPNRREEKKILRKKNRKKYRLNDIYDNEKRVDIRPTEKAPIQSVRGF